MSVHLYAWLLIATRYYMCTVLRTAIGMIVCYLFECIEKESIVIDIVKGTYTKWNMLPDKRMCYEQADPIGSYKRQIIFMCCRSYK